MRPGSVLVNTARGAVIDQDALVDVLRDGPLSAAGLDAFTDEPLPGDHPLRALPNAVLTPHVGWTVEEAFAEFAAIAAEQLVDTSTVGWIRRSFSTPMSSRPTARSAACGGSLRAVTSKDARKTTP